MENPSQPAARLEVPQADAAEPDDAFGDRTEMRDPDTLERDHGNDTKRNPKEIQHIRPERFSDSLERLNQQGEMPPRDRDEPIAPRDSCRASPSFLNVDVAAVSRPNESQQDVS